MDPILLFLMDEGLDLNDIVNNVVEDLGHPIPHIENENRRNVRPRNENYYEATVPQYTDIHFEEHFRMSRRTFEVCIHIYNILSVCLSVCACVRVWVCVCVCMRKDFCI